MSRQILITGWGICGPGGVAGSLDREQSMVLSEAVDPRTLRWRQVSQRPNERFGRLDVASRLALAAVEMIGLPIPSAEASSPRAGIVLESRTGSVAVDSEFLAELGKGMASPTLFTYTLPSAGMAEIAIRFRITGPTLCLMDENDSGSIALWEALELLWSGEIDACVCVACNAGPSPPESHEPTPPANRFGPAGGASALLLETAESALLGSRRPIASIDPASGDQPATERSLADFCNWLSSEGRESHRDLRVRSSPTFPTGLQIVVRRTLPG